MQLITLQKGVEQGTRQNIAAQDNVLKNRALASGVERKNRSVRDDDERRREEVAQLNGPRRKIDGQEEQTPVLNDRAENLSISVFADEEGVALEVRDSTDERLIIRLPVESAVQTHDAGKNDPGALLDRLL